MAEAAGRGGGCRRPAGELPPALGLRRQSGAVRWLQVALRIRPAMGGRKGRERSGARRRPLPATGAGPPRACPCLPCAGL